MCFITISLSCLAKYYKYQLFVCVFSLFLFVALGVLPFFGLFYTVIITGLMQYLAASMPTKILHPPITSLITIVIMNI